MGFLKRLLSLSSTRRGKKKRIPLECDPVEYALPYSQTRQGRQNNEHEAAASRLLRSSSAHFAVVNEVDYASLPPLPHPINDLLATPGPASAAPSIRSTSTQPSYTVTIIGREVIARTEFPNANPPIPSDAAPTPSKRTTTPRRRVNPKTAPVTPRDQDRILRLRQDPSVASLLNMYDEDGRINSHAFSNTPPEVRGCLAEGREQIRRTGSTLRQLLGSPTHGHDEFEGDISWAERFLGEGNGSTDSLVSESSLGLETPKDFAFTAGASDEKLGRPTFPNDHDLSTTTDTYPTFSSLEVELSQGTELNTSVAESLDSVIKTPRPASQVFGFLTEKKRQRQTESRPVSALSLRSTDSWPDADDTAIPIPVQDDTQPRIFPKQVTEPLEPVAFPVAFDTPALKTAIKKEPENSIRNRVDPDEESPTARKGGKAHSESHFQSQSSRQPPPSRIPRGPRPSAKSLPKPASGHEDTASLSTIASSSRHVNNGGDGFTPEPVRHYRAGSRKVPLNDTKAELRPQRTGSTSTSTATSSSRGYRQPAPRTKSCFALVVEKENSPPPATPPKDLRYAASRSRPAYMGGLPVTPVRHHSLLRVAGGEDPPSPASSSELSPVARQMMTSVREKRMRARERERERGKSRSRSRLRA
ncbi:hypothetical protein GLOTRDRAFT_138234 [Gloeophyllum trabeum ATCC 11539]|uniref:Uncharacterized protein n=1 Tax=Gloeophyllum trabeum (strain ATCC 11539 / FP-39264 / Madison 617) TaxID=670483 RepID=S7QB37_GLOTA|nr:uncharacterized protein GLOTRDRAFT_138234 [Gloeophyllum trabeum ATCC 11539]EPQ56527.1 hypothetical protein GLOTRDRAFT_138234 [Gloeophyllum trabeum ATCC 11539]